MHTPSLQAPVRPKHHCRTLRVPPEWLDAIVPARIPLLDAGGGREEAAGRNTWGTVDEGRKHKRELVGASPLRHHAFYRERRVRTSNILFSQHTNPVIGLIPVNKKQSPKTKCLGQAGSSLLSMLHTFAHLRLPSVCTPATITTTKMNSLKDSATCSGSEATKGKRISAYFWTEKKLPGLPGPRRNIPESFNYVTILKLSTTSTKKKTKQTNIIFFKQRWI